MEMKSHPYNHPSRAPLIGMKCLERSDGGGRRGTAARARHEEGQAKEDGRKAQVRQGGEQGCVSKGVIVREDMF